MKLIMSVIWFIFLMIGLSASLTLISTADTLGNIGGLLLLSIIIVISKNTKCFTDLNFKKHEK